MENTISKDYFSLRYLTTDSLHKRGDVQNCSKEETLVGQTSGCEVKLERRTEYEDTCYAVIRRTTGTPGGWILLRQEKDADISVNGVPVEIAVPLTDGDHLVWDKTHVVFRMEQGTPQGVYIQKLPLSWKIWSGFLLLALCIAGVGYLFYLSTVPMDVVFESERQDIYEVRAESLLVVRNRKDTLYQEQLTNAKVGTGFLVRCADRNYFVTARHCLEYWLNLDGELKPDTADIKDPSVRWAIEAEFDPSIELISKVTILDGNKREVANFYSSDFTMDKSRDKLYECGDWKCAYLWRSVVSSFESRDAELGDVAVAECNIPSSEISLAGENNVLHRAYTLYGFGYPQSTTDQEARLTQIESKMVREQHRTTDWFICEKSFDSGFSGGPVFTKNFLNRDRKVVGIVSRRDKEHTLIVPVSQIHKLIKKTRHE
jgi:hypothetical protein